MALSCLVVFVVTYVLILPAFTLTQEKAEQQGGIDIPAMETAAEEVSGEKPSSAESKTEAGSEAKTEEKATPKTKSDNKTDGKTKSGTKAETETSSSSSAKAAALTDPLKFEGDGFTIAVDDKKSVLPANAEVVASELLEKPEEGTKAERKAAEEAYKNYYDKALEVLNDETEGNERKAISFIKLYDITLQSDGEAVQPEKPVGVTISYDALAQEDLQVEKKDGVRVIHFTEDEETGEINTELLENESVEVTLEQKKMTEATFEAEGFSVYAVVYTVDFHWSANGKTYNFSIPGGDFLSFQKLVETLGIANDANIKEDSEKAETAGAVNAGEALAEAVLSMNDVEVSDETREFVADVEKIEFSSPELVDVSKAENDTTVGEIKKDRGLEVQHSAELTEEQIAEIDAQAVEAGDWALISLKPFDTEETMTITMKNGDQFVVKVTDAQDPSVYVGKKVIIYDNGEQRAMLSNGYTYEGHYRLNSIPLAEADSNEAAIWTVEHYNNNYYLKASNNKYLTIINNDVGLVDNRSVATPLKIDAGGNPDYRIYSASNYNQVLSYSTNNDWGDGYFSAPGGKNGSPNQEWLYIREVESVPDRAGDWLLYFDDDFDEITIHVGETISLRPYNKWEWKEGNVNVQTAHWNIGGRNNNYWNQIDANDGNGAHKESWDDGGTGGTAGFHWTAYVKEDGQLSTHYWAVQGRATQTGDYILTNTKNGKTITVHVVEGDPVNKPSTISNIANIKVNLFDYDFGGRLDVGEVNGETNKNLANNSNFKNESVNQMSGSDHFYFLSSGSGDNSSEPWNSYTKDRSNPNIVKDTLDNEGYPVLNGRNQTGSLKYLFDTSEASQSWHGGSGNNGMIAYPGVVGMFQKDSKGYYYFNSNTNYYYYDTVNKTSKLYEHTYTQASGEAKESLPNDKPIGFFPFHDYDATHNVYVNQNDELNHHVGMSMELEFMLPKNRKDDNNEDIIFDFSGDDDLWVFVEWEDDQGNKQSKLLLDLGGIHQPIHGDINFTNGANTKFMETNRPYTLKVFYLERGGCDSNCSIRFNLPIIQDLVIAKKLTGLTEAEKEKYKDEEFTYEVIVNNELYNYPNPDNRYEKAVIRDADGNDVTPVNFTIVDGQVKLKDGYTLTISYLDRSDKFTVAEENTPNMENFERPNAELYYHLPHDASLYETEITLVDSHTQGTSPSIEEWVTPDPPYELENTERVTFTNTLKEKNLEVEKKWAGGQDHPQSINFTVSATIDDGSGGRTAYSVSELKNPNGTDKVFTLSDSNNWRHEIEHLPVNTPDGKFIFYDINESHVDGYVLTGITDLTADKYSYCNVDVVKLWPDSNGNHTEVLQVVLKNSAGKYYKIDEDENVEFVDDKNDATIYTLNPTNNYTHRFDRVPYGEYTAEQLHEDVYNHGLAVYNRPIIQYELKNTPAEDQVNPEEKPVTPVIHKRIDALRDGDVNPDSAHTGEDLTDLYRLYLDYNVDYPWDANGVDLLLVIDHSGSMNNEQWPGNKYRASAVQNALNGENGFISEFLALNENNRWAAVGFKGPDGSRDYTWSLTNPWNTATNTAKTNAGQNGSEVLSPDGTSYEFTDQAADVTLANEGANILSNYTAGFWRAEQFLLNDAVKEDGRKKVVVFITDGVPTLHIDGLSNSLAGAGEAEGSKYYREEYGGCPDKALAEFEYFVNDMQQGGYVFGDSMEFYTIGLGASMQTTGGAALLNGLLDAAYEEVAHTNHYMTVTDASSTTDTSAANTLGKDLRIILGMTDTFSNIVIKDDLSKYVDLNGLANAGSSVANIMRAAKAKVTMTVPNPADPEQPQVITLYENGAPEKADNAKFTNGDGNKVPIITELQYDEATKTIRAVFNPEYRAADNATYTLSFDVKATEEAYTTYAASGYDKYTSGENQGKVIVGDEDTDFLGTTPANATSVDKAGFRSNDEAKATYDHNSRVEELEYRHPVIQVAAKVDIVKINESDEALEGAVFNLYDSRYNAAKTIEENEGYLIEADLQSMIPTDPAGEDAVIRSGKLTEGTYYLVETETPGGYNSLPGPVKITVTDSGGTLNMSAEIAGENVGNKLVKSGNGVWKLKVQNTAGYELPHTGGIGTTIFYILGSLLVVGSAVVLISRRRIRK